MTNGYNMSTTLEYKVFRCNKEFPVVNYERYKRSNYTVFIDFRNVDSYTLISVHFKNQ